MDPSRIIIQYNIGRCKFPLDWKKMSAELKPGASEQGTTGVIHTEYLIPELNSLSTLKPQADTFP